MERVAIFTDASRIELEGGEVQTVYGWVAIDLDAPNTPLETVARYMFEFENSTVHAEFRAVWEAAHAYAHLPEVHIFTDSLYAVVQVSKARGDDSRRNSVRVYPELITEVASLSSVTVHHVKAHRSVFYNELVDNMVGRVTRGEMELKQAQNWARKACKRGVLEVELTRSGEVKRVRRSNTRTTALMEALTGV